MGGLRALGWERLVVVLLGGIRVEAEVELVAPAEVEPGTAERVVAQFGGGVPLGQIGGAAGPYWLSSITLAMRMLLR